MKKIGFVVAGSLLALSAFAQDEGVTVGGYVDAGWELWSQDKNGAGTMQRDVNQFVVREGAIYLGKKWGTEWEVFSDFAYSGKAGGLVLLSQAFVAQNMENGFSWKLGQMDGIFGYYAGRVDSHAHRLTDTGYIQNAYLPRTHTGWLGAYSFSDMLKVNLLVANDNEQFGTTGTTGSAGAGTGLRSADFGMLVNADFDAFSADLGAYFMTGEAGKESDLGYVVSAVAEANFNPLSVGVYGVYFKNDADVVAPAKDEADFGIGANVGFDVNEQFGTNLRIEYVGMSDKTAYFNPITGAWRTVAGSEIDSVISGTIGGHYKFNDNVVAKLDFSYTSIDASGAGIDVDPVMGAQAGVVANF